MVNNMNRRIELEALITEREGMIAENETRKRNENALAYGDSAFNSLADRMRLLNRSEPTSPPEEAAGLTRKTGKCKGCSPEVRLCCWNAMAEEYQHGWNDGNRFHRATSTPPEMPEVDPMPPNQAGTAGMGIPTVLGRCTRYPMKIGKKSANSCVGCTVGCPGKGKQEQAESNADEPDLEGEGPDAD
jgi:hypothetical protein